jgi:two-component system, NarL family, response regulator
MTKTDPVRILIADDHPVVREGLVALISRRSDMQVVAEASNGQEAVEQFLRHRPDIALLDLRMPVMDGVEAITAIREKVPTARLIVLTAFDGDEDIDRGLRAGANAYLLKDAPRDGLLKCIREVHEGQTVIPPAIAAKLADRLTTSGLTRRETQVLRLVADGMGNREIAAELSIGAGTVKTHVSSILAKLNAADRTQAATIALRRGILRL